jgi:hypothetical protein
VASSSTSVYPIRLRTQTIRSSTSPESSGEACNIEAGLDIAYSELSDSLDIIHLGQDRDVAPGDKPLAYLPMKVM